MISKAVSMKVLLIRYYMQALFDDGFWGDLSGQKPVLGQVRKISDKNIG